MTAYFVHRPRSIGDLMVPHRLEEERSFEIVKQVTVDDLAYENFMYDLYPQREFLLDGYGSCRSGDPMQCLLVRYRDAKDGILVTTLDPELVEYAAYYRGGRT